MNIAADESIDEGRLLHASQFAKPRVGGYRFGCSDAANRLRELADHIESDGVAFQGAEVVTSAPCDEFVMTWLTLKFAEKAPLPKEQDPT